MDEKLKAPPIEVRSCLNAVEGSTRHPCRFASYKAIWIGFRAALDRHIDTKMDDLAQ